MLFVNNGFFARCLPVVIVSFIFTGAWATTSTMAQSVQPTKSAKIVLLKNRISILQDQINDVENEIVENSTKLIKLVEEREETIKQQDLLGVSPESFGDILKTLQAQRVQLMIDLSGLDARRESLAQIQKNAAEANPASSVLELSTQLVDMQKKKLDRTRKLASEGSVSPSQVDNAEIDYLNARLKLANASRPADVSPRITDELLNVSLDQAEKKARLAKAEALLKTFIEARSVLLKADDLAHRIDSSKSVEMKLKRDLETYNWEVENLTMEMEKLESGN